MNRKYLKSFSLVELIIAVIIFTIVFSSIGLFSADAFRFLYNNQKQINAQLFMQESINALILNKNELWKNIADNADQTPKHMTFSQNKYQIANGSTSQNDITYSFVIDKVYRDSNGAIATSGTEDLRSKKIVFTSSWTDLLGLTKQYSSNFYINDWNTLAWTQTTQADFNPGTHTNTVVTNTSGGEVKLQTQVYGDWCAPTGTLTSYDLPGSGLVKSVFAIPGNAFTGTGGNASGLAFANILISDDPTPVVTVPGTYDGYKTNATVGDGPYAYFATDTNEEEVIILDLQTTPYTKVGYFNGAGNADSDDVFVVGNKGYMIQYDKFRIFDITSKTGSRPLLGTHTLLNRGRFLFVVGNYAYVFILGDAIDMQILDVSNPASIQYVGSANINVPGVQINSFFVRPDGNRAYIGTNSHTGKEVYIINTSTKIGNQPQIGTYETSGMNVMDITVVDDNKKMIVVGTSAEEYQVVNITNEANPVKCGGTNIDTGINSIASVSMPSGNAYSYIVTNDTASELKVIRGGPGGGGGPGGIGVAATGNFVSTVYDSGASSYFYTIAFNADIPANGVARAQIRSGNSSDLSAATWVGPDGTNATYFTVNQGNNIHTGSSQRRYIQYKIFMDSDTVNSPVFKDLTITHQRV